VVNGAIWQCSAQGRVALRIMIGERQPSSYFLLTAFREDFESWQNKEISIEGVDC